MKQFSVGQQYYMFSPCDQECTWEYTVISRTAKTITLQDEDGKQKRCRVHELFGEEAAHPLGRYSMAPTLTASKIITHKNI